MNARRDIRLYGCGSGPGGCLMGAQSGKGAGHSGGFAITAAKRKPRADLITGLDGMVFLAFPDTGEKVIWKAF